MPEEMVIFTRTYDLLTWLLPLAEKFPRSQRFVVTRRLQDAVLNFQELIIEANNLRGASRADKLRTADAELRKARLYLRLCERWGWMNSGQYRHVSALVAEVGRLLGGWLKTVTTGP
ncbi:MAG: diversity-generating retroelement protein Avd [Chloroflexota bacterium]